MYKLIKVPLKFGLIGGGMVIIMLTVFHLADTNPLIEIKMFDFIIIPIFLFFGIKEFRDSYNSRLLEFWEGMTVGFVVYTTIAIVTSVFVLTYLGIDEGAAMDNYISDRITILESSREQIVEKMGESVYDKSYTDVKATTIWDLTLDNFLKKMMIGLLLTIMFAVIMRKKAPEDGNK